LKTFPSGHILPITTSPGSAVRTGAFRYDDVIVGCDTGESRQEFLLGKRPLYTRTVKDQKTRALDVGEELRKIPSHIRRAHYLLQLIQPLSHLGGKLLSSMTLQEIRGNLVVGFRNPADTGIFYGWYCAIFPTLMVSQVCLDVTPVFDRPLLLLLAMFRLFFDRDVRNAIAGLRER